MSSRNVQFDTAVEVLSLLVQWLEKRDANVHSASVNPLRGEVKASVMASRAAREIEAMLSEVNAPTTVANRWEGGGHMSRTVDVHVTTTAGTRITVEIWYMPNREA